MADSHSHEGAHEQVGHVVPWQILAATWGILMVLTFVTVAATWKDFGSLNLFIAMAIATVKASLVVLYFMHLRYDKPFNSVIFVVSLSLVMLFILLALLDTSQYQPGLIPGYAPAMAPG